MKTMQEFIEKTGTTAIFEWASDNPFMSGNMNHYKVTIKVKNRRYTSYYSQGYGVKRDPQVADVLSCLVMDASSFENSRDIDDFIAETGFDVSCMADVRRIEKIYKACEKTLKALRRLYSADELQELYNMEL